ncbi:DUF6134 family protein [uncultured Thalassospira sp.]|uniref:DUF6134 family protein n=1 Tax=uncultured Thalassospira sp. TaxID=404382 RepID=UPI0030DCD5F5|tara:strand:+ start:4047 stop:4700 length:654 start_codon:yes stop_codon:yes gene_type:complete
MSRILLGGVATACAIFAIFYTGLHGAKADETLNYKVFKDGDPIGFEKVVLSDTADGQIAHITTETSVRVLFLQFHYHHDRTETWKNDHLVSVKAETDDDGTPYAWLAEYEGDCYEVAGKGVPRREECNAAWPLTLWREDITAKTSLYSVIDAAPYAVSVAKTVDTSLTLNDRNIPATHYVMSGDITRDLWYGKDGKLLKTSFKKKGYDIDFIRVDAP